MSITSPNDNSYRLGVILDEILERVRSGHVPDLAEYRQKYPELADELESMVELALSLEPDQRLDHSVTQSTRQSVGVYQLEEVLGRGGMGVVYRAFDPKLDRHVALKVLPGVLCEDQEKVARFQREARAAGRLNHPNIVGVFEVGQQDNVNYYVMQLVQGVSLEHWVSFRQQSRTPSAVDALATLVRPFGSGIPVAKSSDEITVAEPGASHRSGVGLQRAACLLSEPNDFRWVALVGVIACRALHHAHCHGIVHRDIKPSNLMIDVNGQLWVTDFGLAKLDESDLTRSGDLLGTLRYVPPEGLRGFSDPRSDVYSLGLTLYELAVLQPAYPADDRLQLLKQLQTPVAGPRQICPAMPRDLETIILKATASEPQDRYLTAEQMASDLDRFLDGEPIQARRSSTLHRLKMWCQRQPLVASLLLLTAVLLVSMTIGSFRFGMQLKERLAEVEAANRTADERLLESYVSQANAYQSKVAPGNRRAALQALAKAQPLAETYQPDRVDELRDRAIRVLSMVDVNPDQAFARMGIGSDWPSAGFDAQVSKMLRVNDEGRVESVDLANGRRREYSGLRFNPHRHLLAVSDDGRWGAAGGERFKGPGSDFWILDLEAGRPTVHRALDGLGYLQCVEFSSDGSRVCLFESQPGPGKSLSTSWEQALVLDVPSGDVLFRYGSPQIRLTSAAFSEDGQTLALGGNREVYLIDLIEKKLKETVRLEQWVRSVALAGFDQTLWVGTTSGTLSKWVKTESGYQLPPESQIDLASRPDRIQPHPKLPITLVTMMNGRSALHSSRSLQPILEHPFRMMRVSDDGLRIAFSNQADSYGRLDLIVPDAARVVEVSKTKKTVVDFDFTPDGTALVVVNQGEYGFHWVDTESGRVRLLAVPQNEYFGCQFSTDGELLLAIARNHVELLSVPSQLAGAGQDAWELLTSAPAEPIFGRFHLNQSSVWIAEDGVLRCLDLDTREEQKRVPVSSSFDSVAFSPSQEFCALGRRNESTLIVYELASGRPVLRVEDERLTWRTANRNASFGCFSADNQWLAVSLPGRVEIYSTSNWQLEHTVTLESPTIGKLAFSKDYLAIAQRHSVGLYRLPEFSKIATLSGYRQLTFASDLGYDVPMIKFSPDGRMLAAGSANGRLVIWDLPALRRELKNLSLDWSSPGSQ